jgi:hypothetical protein
MSGKRGGYTMNREVVGRKWGFRNLVDQGIGKRDLVGQTTGKQDLVSRTVNEQDLVTQTGNEQDLVSRKVNKQDLAAQTGSEQDLVSREVNKQDLAAQTGSKQDLVGGKTEKEVLDSESLVGAKTKLEAARRKARRMGIDSDQLYLKEGTVWYRSHDYGEMENLNLPSADTVTLERLLDDGKGWGQGRKQGVDKRPLVPRVVNVEQIVADAKEYPDQRFLQYLVYGGPANLDIPFRTEVISENYKMTRDGEAKVLKAVSSGVRSGAIIEGWRPGMVVREHKTGAIPKSRKDRSKHEQGLPCDWRAISDMRKAGLDGLSVNSMTGSHGTLKLAQGERIHACIKATRDRARERGLDPTKIVAIKVDIKSAYRNFFIAVSDLWAMGFMFQGTHYIHAAWPFGNVASVYNFLRFPLLLVWYLSRSKWFKRTGATSCMYFDDNVVFAHAQDMPFVADFVLKVFNRWGVPRQITKWKEENRFGIRGYKLVTILGLQYDLEKLTVGIPPNRVTDILEELREFTAKAKDVGQPFKKWESMIGVLGWMAIAIPQIRPLLTSAWYFKKQWRGATGGKGIRRIKAEIKEDWDLIDFHVRKWNGRGCIILKEWEPVGKLGFSKDMIEPASDASGRIGWGAVCSFGYIYDKWSEEEINLPIHLKEGLALWMLIAVFGEDLKGTEVHLRLRSDNQGLVKALKRGRSNNPALNVIVRMIMDILIEMGMVLRAWRAKGETTVDVDFIGTKFNLLADAISRGNIKLFLNTIKVNCLTDKFPQCIQRRKPSAVVMKNWIEGVKKMTSYMATQ